MMRFGLGVTLSALVGLALGWMVSHVAPLPRARPAEAMFEGPSPASDVGCEGAHRRAIAVLDAELQATQQRVEELESFKYAYEGDPPHPPADYPEPARMRAILEEIAASSDGEITSIGPVDCREYPCAARINLRLVGSDPRLSLHHLQVMNDLVRDHPELSGLTLFPRYASDEDAQAVVATVTVHGSSVSAKEAIWTMRTNARRSVGLDQLAHGEAPRAGADGQ